MRLGVAGIAGDGLVDSGKGATHSRFAVVAATLEGLQIEVLGLRTAGAADRQGRGVDAAELDP